MSRLRSLVAICSVSALGLVAGPAVSASGAQPPGKAPAVNRLATNPPPPSQIDRGPRRLVHVRRGGHDHATRTSKDADPEFELVGLVPCARAVRRRPGQDQRQQRRQPGHQQAAGEGVGFGLRRQERLAGGPTTASPVGQETIPFCDRSQFAPMFIGSGFQPKNLACSGAIVDSKVNDEKQGGGVFGGGSAFKVLKPGIDFKTITAPFAQHAGAGAAAAGLRDAAEGRQEPLSRSWPCPSAATTSASPTSPPAASPAPRSTSAPRQLLLPRRPHSGRGRSQPAIAQGQGCRHEGRHQRDRPR